MAGEKEGMVKGMESRVAGGGTRTLAPERKMAQAMVKAVGRVRERGGKASVLTNQKRKERQLPR